jgi:processive 1,2-diacylglycerol beta-glucosyltransferase
MIQQRAGSIDHAAHPMRILITYLEWGGGPRNAVAALEKALGTVAPDAEVRVAELSGLDRSGLTKRLVASQEDWRHRVAHRRPMSLPYRLRRRAVLAVDRWTGGVHRGSLRSLLGSWRADVVVALAGPAQHLAALRRRGETEVPMVHVCPDFVVQPLNAVSPCEVIAVGSQGAADELAALRLPGVRVVATGIPIDPIYQSGADGEAARRDLGLNGETTRPFLLVPHTRFNGPLATRLDHLLRIGVPCDIVVVGAPDAEIRRAADNADSPGGHRVRVMGHTHRMPDLLAAADLIVTKPGGLTTAQALASGCVIALLNPLPDVEQGNLEYVLATGAAIRVYHEATLPLELTRLLCDHERLLEMQRAARRAARPGAARAIAELAVGLVPPTRSPIS